MTREKNSINVAIKNLTDIGISSLMYWVLGFALMFGTSYSGLFGTSHFLANFSHDSLFKFGVFFLFQAMFCSTSATIVSGAVAERMRYSSYIITTVMVSALIYPVFGHWAWGGLQGADISLGTGWLADIGFVDFAGSTVVHSVGGYVGLAGIIILGARKGRFNQDGTAREIQGSNIPMAVAGTFILWFGWIGFNGGSTLAFSPAVPGIILNTCIAAAAGLVFTMAAGWIITGIPNVNFVINGTLAGLVAITAGCHAVTAAESALIGAAGGLVMLGASALLEKLKLDDAVGAVPVHLAAGIWGTLAVGIFGDSAILGTQPIFGSQLAAQAIGAAVCAAWSFGVSFVILKIVNTIKPMRVTAAEEEKGLNIAEHGASTEIYDLYASMEEQAQTGDLSIRLKAEPFTEIGQIAALYNKVMQNLENTTVAQDEYREILQTVSEGLFLLTNDYTICPNYSEAAKKILYCSHLEGRNFLLLMSERLPERTIKALNEFLPILFDPDYKQRTVSGMNPLMNVEMYIRRSSSTENAGAGQLEKKQLSFTFTRIYNTQKTKIRHVMVIVQDNTEQKELLRLKNAVV